MSHLIEGVLKDIELLQAGGVDAMQALAILTAPSAVTISASITVERVSYRAAFKSSLAEFMA